MNTQINLFYKENLTGQIFQIISHARLSPGYSMVTVCRPVNGGEDVAVCPSRFRHSFSECPDPNQPK